METAHTIKDSAALPWVCCAESSEPTFALQLGDRDPWLNSGYDSSVSTAAHMMLSNPSDGLDPNAHFGSAYGADSDWNDNMFNAPSHFQGTGYMPFPGLNSIAT